MPRETLIKVREGTTAQWATADAASGADPTRLLAAGEPGRDTTLNLLKFGDGVSTWAALPPAQSGTYVPADPVVALTYNGDGTVATATENGIVTSFTYNGDGTVATTTRLGVTRTYTYVSGNLTAVA